MNYELRLLPRLAILRRPYDVAIPSNELELIRSLRSSPDFSRKPLVVPEVSKFGERYSLYPWHCMGRGDWFVAPMRGRSEKSVSNVLYTAATRNGFEVSISYTEDDRVCCVMVIPDLDRVKMIARTMGVHMLLSTERKELKKEQKNKKKSWDHHNARKEHKVTKVSQLVLALERGGVSMDVALGYERAVIALGRSVADLFPGQSMFWPGVKRKNQIEAHASSLGFGIELELSEGEGPDGDLVTGFTITRVS